MAWSTSTWHRPRKWHTTRGRILKRDAHTCQRCGRPANQVDHRIPQHLGGPDTDDNLEALCTYCHRTKSSHEGGTASATRRTNIGYHPLTREQPPGLL